MAAVLWVLVMLSNNGQPNSIRMTGIETREVSVRHALSGKSSQETATTTCRLLDPATSGEYYIGYRPLSTVE
jgi:hypothetical protein